MKLLVALIASFLLLFSFVELPAAQAESTNRCLQFSGNNYAEIGSKLIPVDKDFTVEMWVYSSPTNNGKFAEFISQNDQPFAFYMGVDPNGYLRMGDIWMDTGIKIPTNSWTHIALTHTSTDSLFLFVNGEIVAKKLAGRISYNPAGTNTRLGSIYWPSTAGELFTGCLDDVRIWSVVRTPAEISNYKDINMLSSTSTGLLASYSFDNLTGIYDSILRLTHDLQPSSALDSQVFVAKNGALKVPPRGTFISDSITKDCALQNSSSAISQQQNLPKILKVNARDYRQTSVDLLINGLPEGTCVGMDTFVIGTTEPIRSTVGIVSAIDSAGNTPKFRMNLDTSAHECGGNNNNIEVRGWWAYQGRFSQYGEPFQIPNCFGTIPAQGSSVIAQQSSVSLVGENGIQSPWALQTALRLKNANLIPAAMRTANIVSDVVKDLNGCHAPVKIAVLQQITNGSWVDVGNLDSWEKATNCDPVHPTRPIKAVSLPDTTVLRWRVSTGTDWEVFSAPFIHVAGASATIGTSTNTNTNTTKIELETPTNFSVSLQGKEIQIRVTLPAKTRSKVSSVALVSTGLGILANNPLIGAVESSFGIFKIPLVKLEGKAGIQKVFIESRGLGMMPSPKLGGEIDLSKYISKASVSPSPKITSKASPTPKASVKATVKPKITKSPITPKPSAVNAIKCAKGSIVRTFLAKTCPPGWKIYG